MSSQFKRFRLFAILMVFSAFVTAFLTTAYGVEGLTKPKYEQQIITVGGTNADVPGFTAHAVQIAVDALRERGGTVKLGPGRYEIDAPIKLYSNIDLVGSGEKTVLHKVDGFTTNFIIDADYGMLKVTVKDASGFRIGSGIQLYDDDNKDGWDVTTARITAIDGHVLYIDTYLVRDYRADRNGVISNACSLVEGVGIENARIADFVVEGNANTNDMINGCRGGGIYIHKSKNILIENVAVRNFNGDSFSWQITENITVRKCEASNGTNLGFHPGTGSDSSVIEDCVSHHNGGDGIFLCWRVQNGVFRNNTTYANKRYGISIGHKDTDNIFENNHIYDNGEHGVCFRDENEENSGHRNTFRNNTIENNGASGKEAYGFFVGGETHDITIENNIIRSTGKNHQIGAICIGPKSSRVTEKSNTITGHPGVVKK